MMNGFHIWNFSAAVNHYPMAQASGYFYSQGSCPAAQKEANEVTESSLFWVARGMGNNLRRMEKEDETSSKYVRGLPTYCIARCLTSYA